jgi:hypothetical protein
MDSSCAYYELHNMIIELLYIQETKLQIKSSRKLPHRQFTKHVVGAIIDELGRIGRQEGGRCALGEVDVLSHAGTRWIRGWRGGPRRDELRGQSGSVEQPDPVRGMRSGEGELAGGGERECRNFSFARGETYGMLNCTVHLEPRLLDLQSEGPKYTVHSNLQVER